MGRVKNKSEAPASIFEVLPLEHRDVSALFEQIEALCEASPSDAADLFTVLRGELLAHAHAEMAVVYPRLARIKELSATMREAEVEHEVVERLVDELAAMRPDGEQWLARLVVLKEMVMHHVEEEEHEIFDVAKEHLDSAEAERLCAEYLRRKARETGEPELEQARARKEAHPTKGLIARLISVA